MDKLKKNIKVKSKENILEKGFVRINKAIYRKFIFIGYNIGMYITIGAEDDFLNVAVIDEQFLQPFNLDISKGNVIEKCISNYNNEINNLISEGILEEIA